MRDTFQRLLKAGALSLAAALLVFLGLQTAEAQDICTRAYDRCTTSADDSFDRCTERCDNGTGSDACYTRCDTRYETATATCDREEQSCMDQDTGASAGSSSRDGRSPSKPSMAQGNGCYLGECPDDYTPRPQTSPSRPQTQPGTQTPPGTLPYPGAQMSYSWVCQTPVYWCAMGQAGPVGISCWCNNPVLGYANGIVVPQQ